MNCAGLSHALSEEWLETLLVHRELKQCVHDVQFAAIFVAVAEVGPGLGDQKLLFFPFFP